MRTFGVKSSGVRPAMLLLVHPPFADAAGFFFFLFLPLIELLLEPRRVAERRVAASASKSDSMSLSKATACDTSPAAQEGFIAAVYDMTQGRWPAARIS